MQHAGEVSVGQAIFAQTRQISSVSELTENSCRRTCPTCGGALLEIRMKLQCAECHAICETCCEGGRG
jgi:hypothetical protein